LLVLYIVNQNKIPLYNTEVSIGKHLKATRLKAGLTQVQLSKASGVSQASIALYENDVQTPIARNLAALARALNVPMDALVEAANPAPEPDDDNDDNRLHGNSTAAQIQKLVLQLDREAQALVLKQVKLMLTASGEKRTSDHTDTPKRRRNAA